MTTGSFEHALNDGMVTVEFSYTWPFASQAQITKIIFCGMDVTSIVHPEDYEYLNGLVYENALEHKQEEKMCAAEAKWERDRDDKMMRELP